MKFFFINIEWRPPLTFLLRAGILFLIFSLPFFYNLKAYNSFELIKMILFRIMTEILFLTWICGSLSQKRPIVKSSGVLWGVLLFLASIYVSSLFGVDFQQSFFGEYFRGQGLLTFFHYVLFFMLISQMKSYGLKVSEIVWAIVLSSFIISLQVLWQWFGHMFLGINVPLFNDRYVLNFGNPNFLGAFLALCVPAVLYLFGEVKRVNLRLFLGVGVVLQFMGIVLSGSRGALLAGVVAVLIYGALVFKNKAVSMLGVVGMIGIVLVTFLYIASVGRESPYENRQKIWENGLEAGLVRPVFGWGLENFEVAMGSVLTNEDFWASNLRIDKAHNEFLEVFVASGVVGLLAYLFLIYQSFKVFFPSTSLGISLRLKRQGNEVDVGVANWCLVMLATFLVVSSTNVLSVTAYIFLWLALGICQSFSENGEGGLVLPKGVLVILAVILLFFVTFNLRQGMADMAFKKGIDMQNQPHYGYDTKNDFAEAVWWFPWERVYKYMFSQGY